MLPLVVKLPAGDAQAEALIGGARHAGTVERIAAGVGVVGEGVQVSGDGDERVVGRPKPLQLRVMRVSARPTGEHLLREQRLAPTGHERATIELGGVQAPQAHGYSCRQVSRGDAGVTASPCA